jgi:hypothetical protein
MEASGRELPLGAGDCSQSTGELPFGVENGGW